MKIATLFLVILVLGIGTATAKTEFYTISKNQKIETEIPEPILQDIENVVDMEFDEEIDSCEYEPEPLDYAKARLSHKYPKWNERKQITRRRRKQRIMPDSGSSSVRLPSLTIPNLIREIKRNKLLHGEVVLAQAILETGWFTSNVCLTKNNLFGLTNPRTKTYYEFNHWTESVAAYYSKVQYKYKGGNYLLWLDKIGYAEAEDYIPALIRVIRQLRKTRSTEKTPADRHK